VTAEKPLVSLGLRQCDSSKVNCRTRMAASVTQKRESGACQVSHEKSLQNRRLRQCDSSETTVANQLSQAICVSATVPYYIGTACSDRRSDAVAQREVAHRGSIPHGRFARGWPQ
jgi:hypothetical protein